MKKFLALVLALVMTMSLVTISAGADFTDDASITYEEAVDVMTAIGVVGGYADGSFNPKGTLTRGAAAKIICNMILGPTEAGALSTVEAPFSDVPADHVFAGYIAYCVSEGIVSGYTDGTFRPAGTLTGYAFWKMLLGALGYDAAIEGYTGANFSINVAKRGLNIGLDDGLTGKFAGTKALTREEACLYAFNTLKAQMVEYDNNSTISIGDVVISNSSKAEGKVDKDDNAILFMDEYFADLKADRDEEANADAYGRPSHGWEYDKDDIGVYADSPVLTYTEAVEVEDLIDDLDDEGYEIGEFTLINANDEDEKDIEDDYDADDEIGGTGTLVEVFGAENADGDDVVTYIVVIETKLAEVEGLKKDKTSTSKVDERTIELDIGDVEYEDELISNFDEIYDAVEEGDYLLYTLDTDNNVETLVIPETIEGKVTKVTSSEAKIDGEVYAIAANAGSVAVDSKEQTVWLDTYGNVMMTEADAAEANVIYVVASYDEEDKWGNVTYYIQAVTTDGEVIELNIGKNEDGATALEAIEEDNKYVYEYTTDSDGIASLSEAGRKKIKNQELTASSTKVEANNGTKYYYADDVKFIFIDGAEDDLDVDVAEGAQKVTTTAEKVGYIVLDDDGVEVKYVFIDGTTESSAAEDLVFVKADATYTGTALDNDGERGYTFTFYLNGEKMVEIVDGAISTTELEQGFYTYAITSEGTYDLDEETDNVEIAAYEGYSIVKDKYVTITGTDVEDYTLDGEIYDLSDNSIDTLSDLADMLDEEVELSIAVIYDTEDEVITSIYVF